MNVNVIAAGARAAAVPPAAGAPGRAAPYQFGAGGRAAPPVVPPAGVVQFGMNNQFGGGIGQFGRPVVAGGGFFGQGARPQGNFGGVQQQPQYGAFNRQGGQNQPQLPRYDPTETYEDVDLGLLANLLPLRERPVAFTPEEEELRQLAPWNDNCVIYDTMMEYLTQEVCDHLATRRVQLLFLACLGL